MEQDLKDLLRNLLRDAARKIDRDSFEQEPQYTSAFFGKLHNERLVAENGSFIELSFSSSNDRGPGSAENKTGIDIGMVFRWTNPSTGDVFEKAVLAQAKNRLLTLDTADSNDLKAQCKKMRGITQSYVTLDCPYDRSIPTICRSNESPPYWTPTPIGLDDYLIDTVLECLDGDISQSVIDVARKANRQIVVNTNTPIPKPKPRAKRKP